MVRNKKHGVNPGEFFRSHIHRHTLTGAFKTTNLSRLRNDGIRGAWNIYIYYIDDYKTGMS